MKNFVIILAVLLLATPLFADCERGDVDANGVVNIADVLIWFQYLYGVRDWLPTCGGIYTPEQYAACEALDVNQDGDVCPGDPMDLLKYIYGQIQLDLGCE